MSDYFVHPLGVADSSQIGKGTRIWAFAHVLAGAVIGADCNICDHVFIENDVHIGDRVTIKCGVQLWDGARIEDDVFIGPNATFTNDPFPRSRQKPAAFPQTLIRSGASIGANATILPGIVVGRNALIGSGAVITRDVPPNAIVMGNPARITGYADSASVGVLQPTVPKGRYNFAVRGVRLVTLEHVEDLRGHLSFAEFPTHLPFIPKRYFVIWDVPSAHVRGGHAHRELEQMLVCLKGSCHVMVDDGLCREEVVLDSPTDALYLPSMVWGVQYKYTTDAVLLVLASDRYDPQDYIRNYDDFIAAIRPLQT